MKKCKIVIIAALYSFLGVNMPFAVAASTWTQKADFGGTARMAAVAFPIGSYTLTAPSPVSSVTLTPDKSSPRPVGTAITFTAAASGGSGSYQYYFTYRNPSGTWAVGQAYSSTPTWTWNTTGLPTGVYSIQVWARNAGSTASYEAYRGLSYTLTTAPSPVSSVTLTPDKSSPRPVGTAITFTAAASGGSGSYQYYFTYRNPSGTWRVGQAYSSTPTWTWSTTGLLAGVYAIQVWARNAGSTASYEAYKSLIYTLTAPLPVSSVTLTPDKSSPRPAGTAITFTAAASGGSGSYQYYFTYRNPSGTWRVGQAYSSTPTWTWNTTGLSAGVYAIQVWARNAGSTASYEAYKSLIYTLTAPSPVSSVTLTPDKSLPRPAGTAITFTAAASGGSGSYQYYFTYRNPSGTWRVGQAYSSTPTWTWNTSGLPAGVYAIQVWARNAGSTASYEAYTGLMYTLTTALSPVLTGVPSGLTNQKNLVISVGGQDIVAYRFKLNDGSYSEEIPVSQNITFSADVDIYGNIFAAGSDDLQELLDYHPGYIDSITFRNVNSDTQVLFLLNDTRIFLEKENILYLEGTNIDQLEVYMNSTPGTPARIVDQSFASNPQSITYSLSTDMPETDFIRIINRSGETASFRFNLNNKLFASDSDLLNAIQASSPEYPDEPIERKVWRFIRDSRYHWYPLSEFWSFRSWTASSPSLFFNSIGFGFCGDSAELFCQIMTMLGYQTRNWGLGGHIVPEVLIDGKWQMYDPDLQVYYYLNDQGGVAGVEDLAKNPELITNPISRLPDAAGNAYSPVVADIYSSTENNFSGTWYSDNSVNNYSLNTQIPPRGILEFPAVFGDSLLSYYLTDVPYYSNARLTVPRDWTGTVNTPLVIHSIGYDRSHTLSVIARDSAGNWQTEPTIVNWTTDSWAPITDPKYSYTANPVTLSTSEPAIVYYTTDGTIPTTASQVYTSPVSISAGSVLKFFGIDTAGNQERVKYYDPATGYLDYDVSSPPPPAQSVTLTADKNSPQAPGLSITFAAIAAGGSGDYEYRFEIRYPDGIWRLPQPYSSLASWRWNTSGIETGTYSLLVSARSKGSMEAYEIRKGVYFAITTLPLSIDTSSLSAGPEGIEYGPLLTAADKQTPYAWIYDNPDIAPLEMGTPLRRRPYRTDVIRAQEPQ